MEELLTLPGVGRKTANLVLILAHRSPDNICVDTHVHRISNRLGWVKTRTPDETEQALYAATHRKWWPVINLYLVTWGQNVCRPVYPLCGSCVLFRPLSENRRHARGSAEWLPPSACGGRAVTLRDGRQADVRGSFMIARATLTFCVRWPHWALHRANRRRQAPGR